MHCLPTFLHSHASADGPMVEQVECQVQLQHCSTVSRDHRLRLLTIETLPNPRRSFSLFFALPMAQPPSPIATLPHFHTPTQPYIHTTKHPHTNTPTNPHTHTPTHTHTLTHTHTQAYTHHCVRVDFRRTEGRRLCASGVSSRFESPAEISNGSRDG